MSPRSLIFLCLFWLTTTTIKAGEFDFLEPSQTNVIYGMDHGAALVMDVYQPTEPNGYAIVFVMGTGFTAYGSYDDRPLKELDRHLLEAGVFPNLMGQNRQIFGPAYDLGFTVFSVNHRLSPAHNWTVQLRDVQRAVQYVRAHAHEFEIDPDWIAGMGHSSGASLIALAAVADDAAYTSLDPVACVSSRLQAVVPVSGIHDLLAAIEQRPGIRAILAGYVGRVVTYQPQGHEVYTAYREASTVHHVDPSDPPMLLIHCADDSVVSVKQSETLASALDQHSIPFEFYPLADGDHGAVFNVDALDPMPYAADWLVQQLPSQ